MKKTSLYLDAELDERLARRAADEGLTKAELIRRTLEGALQRPTRPRFQGIGIIKGGPTDMAANVDRYLSQTGFGES